MDPKTHNVSLFIPVYNVGSEFEIEFSQLLDALRPLACQLEVCIVDDNSDVGPQRFTTLVERSSGKDGVTVRYVRCDRGPSRRENLARAFSSASHEIFCFIDADLGYVAPHLIRAIGLMREGQLDIVTGSRYVPGSKTSRRPARWLISVCYNTAMQVVFGSKVRDHQCGLKVMRKSTVLPLVERMGFDQDFNRGWFWDAELLIRAQKMNLQVVEIPIEWKDTRTSTFSVARELRMLRCVWRLAREMRGARVDKPV